MGELSRKWRIPLATLLLLSLALVILAACSGGDDAAPATRATDAGEASITVEEHMENAEALREAERYEEAVAEYTKAIQLDPNHSDIADAYYFRATSYFLLEQLAPAVQDFSKAISLDPTSPTHWSSRAYAYAQLGEYKKTVDDIDEAIRLGFVVPNHYWVRAISHEQLGQLDQAIKDLDQAIAWTHWKKNTSWLERISWSGWPRLGKTAMPLR